MEQIKLRLTQNETWTYLGGNSDAKKDIELVVRAFDHEFVAVSGSSETLADGESLMVPVGQGRRLIGKHFFAKPTPPHRTCLISYRGL